MCGVRGNLIWMGFMSFLSQNDLVWQTFTATPPSTGGMIEQDWQAIDLLSTFATADYSSMYCPGFPFLVHSRRLPKDVLAGKPLCFSPHTKLWWSLPFAPKLNARN